MTPSNRMSLEGWATLPNEDGRIGPPVSPQNGTSSILGVLGGRDGHDRWEVAPDSKTVSLQHLRVMKLLGVLENSNAQPVSAQPGVALWFGQVGPSFGNVLVHQPPADHELGEWQTRLAVLRVLLPRIPLSG